MFELVVGTACTVSKVFLLKFAELKDAQMHTLN